MAEERTLEREWLQFRMLDVAHNAPDVQIREMRKAFFAGAGSTLEIISSADSARVSPKNRQLTYIALLDEIQRYLDAFKKSSGDSAEVK